MSRKFFSGNSIDQAIMAAARHYKLEPDQIAYSVRDKKTGFLNARRGVVIEVDPAAPERSAETPEPVAAPQAEQSIVESQPDEDGQEPKEHTGVSGGNLDGEVGVAEKDDSDDSDSGARVAGHVDTRANYEPAVEQDDRRPRGRGRSRERVSQRGKGKEFGWDGSPWDDAPSDGNVSREVTAIEIGIERILDVMDLEIEYSITGGETYEIEFTGEDAEYLTEDDGQVLKAIEHILPRIARGLVGQSIPCRVDCDGFRADREAQLVEMANQAASEVVESRRSKTLAPMNPADRRVVHLALVDHEDVDTVSQGQGYMKRVKVVVARD